MVVVGGEVERKPALRDALRIARDILNARSFYYFFRKKMLRISCFVLDRREPERLLAHS